MFQRIAKDIYAFKDCCNVYVLKDGEEAVLIDCGSGAILEHLSEIGVKKAAWVLLTHHHREQCQGLPRLKEAGVKVALPMSELELLAHPERFWNSDPNSASIAGLMPYTVGNTAPYVRPPRVGVAPDRELDYLDEFVWGPYTLRLLGAGGHSPAAMSYVGRIGGKKYCFCGDAVLEGAKMHYYFDSEWDYGRMAGMVALLASAAAMQELEPDILCPSHGGIISGPRRTLDEFVAKLRKAIPVLYRQWHDWFNVIGRQAVSRPTDILGVRRVSEHLIKCCGYIVIADSGKGLMIDCSAMPYNAEAYMNRVFKHLSELYGLSRVDVIIPSHYHGDHVAAVNFVKNKDGAKLWTYENMVDILAHPGRYKLAWTMPGYGVEDVAFETDRVLKDGEVVEWEGYKLKIRHLPGQTEYACGVFAEIDGREVAFTGDNIWNEHELSGRAAFVAFNSYDLDQGYLKCARVLREEAPDIILGGHGTEIADPSPQYDLMERDALEMQEVMADLSYQPGYRYCTDPYWCHFYPYRVMAAPGKGVEMRLNVKNHLDRPVEFSAELRAPDGWRFSVARFEGVIPARRMATKTFVLTVPEGQTEGVFPVTADIHYDGEYIGEFPEAFVTVQ